MDQARGKTMENIFGRGPVGRGLGWREREEDSGCVCN